MSVVPGEQQSGAIGGNIRARRFRRFLSPHHFA
jgi:hypothetical protein